MPRFLYNEAINTTVYLFNQSLVNSKSSSNTIQTSFCIKLDLSKSQNILILNACISRYDKLR